MHGNNINPGLSLHLDGYKVGARILGGTHWLHYFRQLERSDLLHHAPKVRDSTRTTTQGLSSLLEKKLLAHLTWGNFNQEAPKE